jgi:superkiller protein 3
MVTVSMMKKLSIIFLCFWGASSALYAADLTPAQQAKVRAVVSQYCELLSKFASSDTYIDSIYKITSLCSTWNMTTFDDLKENKQILLSDYLHRITNDFNHELSISYEGIQTAEIKKIQRPSMDKSKSEEDAFALIEVVKKIKGHGLNKTVKNVFAVNLKDYKIWGITKDALFEDDDASSMLSKGLVYFSENQYDEALFWFEKSADKGNVEAQFYCGIFYYLQENYSKAIAAFQKAIELNPDYTAAYRNMGIAYARQGDYSKTIVAFQKAARLGDKVAQEQLKKLGETW